ncbi:glycosyltransferase family 2 protein [Clostridium saudiense]|uniref:glycosyltransferase family 2 protein n=1 Tax=Clostridium saudiense TaxID=1414720 RepID=UPI0018A9EC58|nr:glycosyltransferase family 2 protein [Clostridium saudiense]
MESLISVIIPVYNTGQELIKCVESVVNNTYRKVEVIIVDDGSNSETANICDKCCDFFQNVKVFHRENKGVSSSRNFGLDNCNGEYIMFVDSDDTVEDNMIETLYNICKENSADFSIVGYNECRKEEKNISINNSGELIVWENYNILNEFLLGEKIGWNVWGKLYKRDILDNIRFPINKRTAEDMYFIYNVCKVSSKAALKCIPLYNYIKQNESTMASSNCLKFFDTYELIEKVWKECKESRDESLIESGKIFYTKSVIWFLKFILVRDVDKSFKYEILNVRDKLIKAIIQYGNSTLKGKLKIEYIILNRAYPIFKIYALIYGTMKKWR